MTATRFFLLIHELLLFGTDISFNTLQTKISILPPAYGFFHQKRQGEAETDLRVQIPLHCTKTYRRCLEVPEYRSFQISVDQHIGLCAMLSMRSQVL